MHTGEVQVELMLSDDGRVATVTVDHPTRANSMNRALLDRLAKALEDLGRDGALRAVVLTAAGERSFIGGADVREMAVLDPDTARTFINAIHRVCTAIRDLPVPVIARINGTCLGAGLEIAAACDLRIAADHAIFGMPEVRLGIPSVVEAALLPMLVGWGRTRQMLLLGETFGAEQAASWGLVERTATLPGLDVAVEEWLKALLAAAPGAIRAQKALMRQWEDLPIREAIQAGVDAFSDSYRTGEPAAAMVKFLERRPSRHRPPNPALPPAAPG